MVPCVCCQCAEHIGQFRGYQQCERCLHYGHEDDEFTGGSFICNECTEEERSA